MEKEHAELSESQERQARPKRQPEALGIVAVEKGQNQRKPERIGHVLVSAEPEPKRVKQQRVENLNRNQLLALSEKIKIDGSSLRQIYETHLIGERGLRHLVAEYMHDGDLKQALRQEIVDRERDFERDPALRHADDDDTDLMDLPKSSLEELLAKAELSSEQRGEETAFFKARARFEAEELQQHKQRRQLIDTSLAVIIGVLLLLVIILFLSRS